MHVCIYIYVYIAMYMYMANTIHYICMHTAFYVQTVIILMNCTVCDTVVLQARLKFYLQIIPKSEAFSTSLANRSHIV